LVKRMSIISISGIRPKIENAVNKVKSGVGCGHS